MAGTSVPSTPSASRMLRVEFKGQPYDWFNLEEMGDVVRSEDFTNTLRENVVHYFSVPYDCQAIFDEEGLLSTAVDFARALQSVNPYLRVYDTREMPQDVKEQTVHKLGIISSEVARSLRSLASGTGTSVLGAVRPGVPGVIADGYNGYNGTAVRRPSPWPVREAHPPFVERGPPILPGMPPPHCGVPPMAHLGSMPVMPPGMVMPGLRAGVFGLPAGACALRPDFGARTPGGPCGLCGPWAGSAPPSARLAPQEPVTFQLPPDTISSWTTSPRLAGPSAPHYDLGRRPSFQHHPCPQDLPPPNDWRVEVTLSKGINGGERTDRFGFANVPTADGRALLINWLDLNGLLGMWNRNHPDKAIREGDIILAVNGVADDVEAMRVQLQLDAIRMVIQRGSGGLG